jgi:hypothetical protein
VIKVPVKVANSYGRVFEQEIVATVWYDDEAPKPYPIAVLNHGRGVSPDRRHAVGRARYAVPSRWLTRFGFLVVVPTRMGYGESGGDDVEETGPCNRKNYPPGYEAGAQQTITALEAVRQLTENDQFMGSKYPKEWFDAFVEAGGKGEFVLFPPLGNDGHGLFTLAPQIWQPKVGVFLKDLGFIEWAVGNTGNQPNRAQ